ncbi:hypothetical protein CP533_0356 [Ophiocordyceps camponoti-saundersi (nom. inval.)]|nr:hypothetical protein CP533_0356 [Ophiocordyceps camponoti-saundersi (nom. inval.)]
MYCSTASSASLTQRAGNPRATFPQRQRGSRTVIAIFGQSLGPGYPLPRNQRDRRKRKSILLLLRAVASGASGEEAQRRGGGQIAIFYLSIPVGRRFCFVAIRCRVPSFSYRPCFIPRLSPAFHK